VKRLPLLLKVLMLLVCFSFVLSAYDAGSTVNDVLNVPYLLSSPVVDGIENDWDVPQVGMFSLIDSNPPEGAEDLSAWFQLGWNEDGLHLFVHVVDDSLNYNGDYYAEDPLPNSWESDCIEIFIDAGNKDSTSMSASDVQWRAVSVLEGDTLVQCWSAGANLRPNEYTLAWQENTDGYDMEISIPPEGLEKSDVPLGITLEKGTVFGFDLQVTDNDSIKSDDGVRWHAREGDAYGNPSLWGTVILDDGGQTLAIPKVATAPDIDGFIELTEVWTTEAVPEIGMSVIAGGTGNFPDSGYLDLLTNFRAAWNADGFYLFVSVLDDSIYVEDPVTDANEWGLDGVEVYFDGDNSKASSYDGVDDVQWRFVYGVDTCLQGPANGFNFAWNETSDGYDFELGIPAATFEDTNITLEDNKVIGFEVQVADHDGAAAGGAGREGITKWWSESNDSYLHPSLFGTAILLESGAGIAEPEVASNIDLSVAPVITSSAIVSVNVPAGVDAKVSLYNITGQKVKDLAVEGGKASLNAADIPNGVYLCVLKAGDEVVSKKVSVIK